MHNYIRIYVQMTDMHNYVAKCMCMNVHTFSPLSSFLSFLS
uniref:Uncharacterized protein n=1 Tax=Anguilla anguilla TaxID=7936 RepID=A0A0E9TGJ6_ANGAN